MPRSFPCRATLLLLAPLSLCAAVLLEDTFRSPQHPQRQIATTRGHWTLADGIATSTHDQKLYEKNKNHGAVIWYDLNFTDAIVRYSYQANGCETVGFTLNNPKGHVFRTRQNETGFAVLAWASQEHGTRATPLHGTDKGPPLADGKWTDVELRFEGGQVSVKVGDYTRTFQHPGVAAAKSRFGVSYDKGTFRLRDVKVESLEVRR